MPKESHCGGDVVAVAVAFHAEQFAGDVDESGRGPMSKGQGTRVRRLSLGRLSSYFPPVVEGLVWLSAVDTAKAVKMFTPDENRRCALQPLARSGPDLFRVTGYSETIVSDEPVPGVEQGPVGIWLALRCMGAICWMIVAVEGGKWPGFQPLFFFWPERLGFASWY